MKLLVNILVVALAWSASAAELRPLKYIALPSKKPLTEDEILRLGNLKRKPAQDYAHAYRLFHEYAIVIEDRYANDKKYEKAVSAMSKFAKDRCWTDFYKASPSRCKQARENVYLGLNPYCQIVNGGLLYEPYLDYEKAEELRRQVQATLSDFGLSIPNVWRHARTVNSEPQQGFDENLGLSPTQIKYKNEQKRFNNEINDLAKQYESQVPKDDKVARYRARKKALKQARKESWFHTGILEGIKREARENGEEWPDYGL